jgi:PadR family transcriptional regulator
MSPLKSTFDSSCNLFHTPIKNLWEPKRERPEGELVQGTLDMLILKTLAKGAMHGYGIAESIRQISEEVLRVEEGSLYPALHTGLGWMAWSIPNGVNRPITAGQNTTASPRSAANAYKQKQPIGRALWKQSHA